jgi:hypothetical protein
LSGRNCKAKKASSLRKEHLGNSHQLPHFSPKVKFSCNRPHGRIMVQCSANALSQLQSHASHPFLKFSLPQVPSPQELLTISTLTASPTTTVTFQFDNVGPLTAPYKLIKLADKVEDPRGVFLSTLRVKVMR